MAPISLITAILITIFGDTTGYTVIPSDGSWWYDDFLYTDSADWTLDTWYNPSFSAAYNEDIGSHISTCNECAPSKVCTGCTASNVWGWWIRWNEGSNYKDPNRNMARWFGCASHSNVTITARAYFCMDCSSNGGDEIFYFYRAGHAIVGTKDRDQAIWYNSGWPNLGGSGTDKEGTYCTNVIRYIDITDKFEVVPNDWFQITIKQEVQNCNDNDDGRSNNGQQTTAFNSFQIKCDQIITDSPTRTPTESTSIPTKVPTKYPTKVPTGSPTPAPTDIPTYNPTEGKPTTSPITLKPTKTPSINPTGYPSETPTMDPTDNPTERPTTSTTARPTNSPTNSKGLLGDAFGGSQCTDGWIICNIEVFIILLCLGIAFILYWILGAVWYKRRQNNRPIPPHLLVGQDGAQGVAATSVEMNSGGNTGNTQHVTSNKWKSAWEIEQEQQQQQQQQQQQLQQEQQPDGGQSGDAVYAGGGQPGYY